MKTTYFLAALIVAASTTAFGFGPGQPSMAVLSQKDPSKFKVIYDAEKAGKVKMTIINSNDQIVFSQTNRKVDGFIQVVNFAGMDYGDYTIEIADENGKIVQKLAYGKISSVKAVRVSKIAENGKYLLSVSNKGSELINVRIFDGSNNLVHNENRTINGDFGLVYNLSAISGVPTFEVTDNAGNVRTIR